MITGQIELQVQSGSVVRSFKSFGARTGYSLPDADSAAYDEALNYTDVQLKIIQQEGYEAHDFNIFDDRAALLWRKPYVDGAVRELTSGEDRSPEELRRSVEQLMLSAGDRKSDVRATIHAGHIDRSNIRITADVDQTRSLRPGTHKYPRAGAGKPARPGSLSAPP